MSEPMTDERLTEIREEVHDYPEIVGAGMAGELLKEVERLRVENEKLVEQIGDMVGELENERMMRPFDE